MSDKRRTQEYHQKRVQPSKTLCSLLIKQRIVHKLRCRVELGNNRWVNGSLTGLNVSDNTADGHSGGESGANQVEWHLYTKDVVFH